MIKYIKKIPYYFRSMLIIISQIKNRTTLLNLWKKKKANVIFRNGFKFNILQPMDLLIIKETIFDNDYQIDLDKIPPPNKYDT